MAALLGVVQRCMRGHAMIEAGDRVLVAVSGGPDSVGLLALLSHLRRRLGIELVAAHVNHRLRGAESDGDEECAAAAAARLHIPFAACRLPCGLARGGNLEERARKARYTALQRLARLHGCNKIATGHTRDDQAETFLLRLVRGAGPAGLCGVEPRRADGVIRPLLDCRRDQVEQVVRAVGLDYRIDRSNEDPRFQRTHIRHSVLPLLARLNPAVVDSCARAADLLRAQRELVSGWVEDQLAAAAVRGQLDIAALVAIAPALRGQVVRRWLVQQGFSERSLGARHVEAVLRLALAAHGGRTVSLPGGRCVRRRAGWLIAGEAPHCDTYSPRPLSPGKAVALPGGWYVLALALRCGEGGPPVPPDLWSAVCDGDGLPGELTVRPPARGERVRPLGLGGERKLSRIFTDRKVPAEERSTYPVVASGSEVVWVPGVVRGTGLRVTDRTRSGLWLWARRDA